MRRIIVFKTAQRSIQDGVKFTQILFRNTYKNNVQKGGHGALKCK